MYDIYRAGICVPATDGLVHAKYASIEPLWFMQYTLKEEISDCKSTTNNICNKQAAGGEETAGRLEQGVLNLCIIDLLGGFGG